MIFPVTMASFFVLVALIASWLRSTRTYAFAVWVLAFVGVAYCLPKLFNRWAGIPCSDLVSPLIQVAMFGMGATLTLLVQGAAAPLVPPE